MSEKFHGGGGGPGMSGAPVSYGGGGGPAPLLLSGEADYVRMHRTEFTLLMSLKSYVAKDDLDLERKDFLRTVATRILDDPGT